MPPVDPVAGGLRGASGLRTAVALLAFVLSLCLAGAGRAQAPDSGEPNDTPATASGPLREDAPQTGVLEVAGDVDLFVLHTRRDRAQLVLSVSNDFATDGRPELLRVRVLDAGGDDLTDASLAPGDRDPVRQALGRTGTYYVELSHGDALDDPLPYSLTSSAAGQLVDVDPGPCLRAQRNFMAARQQVVRERAALKRSRAADRGVARALRRLGAAQAAAERRGRASSRACRNLTTSSSSASVARPAPVAGRLSARAARVGGRPVIGPGRVDFLDGQQVAQISVTIIGARSASVILTPGQVVRSKPPITQCRVAYRRPLAPLRLTRDHGNVWIVRSRSERVFAALGAEVVRFTDRASNRAGQTSVTSVHNTVCQ